MHGTRRTDCGCQGIKAPIGSAEFQLQAAANGRIERGIEDDILRMETYVAGLGGVYGDDEGNIVIYVPSTENPREIFAALAKSSPYLTLEVNQRRRIANGVGLRLRRGAYPFSQLIAWAEELTPHIRGLGVSSVDADESRNQIAIGVVDVQRAGLIVAEAVRLGIPAGAIIISHKPYEIATETLRSTVDSVASGMQIMNVADELCTLGWNVHRGPPAPEEGSEEGFFTAAHCISNAHAGTVDRGYLYQATKNDHRLAYVDSANFPSFQETSAACLTTVCTQIDAMYARYEDPNQSRKNSLAKLGAIHINNTIASSFTIASYAGNLSGAQQTLIVNTSQLDKIGRTTGWTRGTYAESCVATIVSELPPSTFKYTVLCADKVHNSAAALGDSGAPVFQIDSAGTVTRYGVEFSAFSADSSYGTTDEGIQYCNDMCVYSYNRWARINLFLPAPPY